MGRFFFPLFILVACAAFLIILGLGLKFDPKIKDDPQLSSLARDFSLPILLQKKGNEHQVLSWEELKGRPTVINFWSSWCRTCRQESAFLNQMKHLYPTVQIVGIAVQDTGQAALAAAESWDKSYLILWDEHGEVAISYGVSGVPETLFIDEVGYIRAHIRGPLDPDLWMKNLQLIVPSSALALKPQI